MKFTGMYSLISLALTPYRSNLSGPTCGVKIDLDKP